MNYLEKYIEDDAVIRKESISILIDTGKCDYPLSLHELFEKIKDYDQDNYILVTRKGATSLNIFDETPYLMHGYELSHIYVREIGDFYFKRNDPIRYNDSFYKKDIDKFELLLRKGNIFQISSIGFESKDNYPFVTIEYELKYKLILERFLSYKDTYYT